MKKYFFIAAFLLCMNIPVYAAKHPLDITGSYDCSGTEVATTESYSCVMELKKTNQTYALKSTCQDGSSYVGTGIYDIYKGNFSVAFINPKKPEETGIATAEVGKDYVMNSTWTYLHKTNVSHDVCSKRARMA